MASYEPEIILVENKADEISCDGGNKTLGHPEVWYKFGDNDRAECMYCDRLFIKKRAASAAEKKKAA